MAKPCIRTAVGALLTVALMLDHTVALATPIPGTQVELQPPAGFTPSRRFPGFEHLAQGASIMVNEIPTGYAELRAGFTREGLASRGMRLIEMKDVAVAGAPALLLHVAQHADGFDFRKWMLLAPRGNQSVLVVGTFPRTAPASLGEAVRLAVLSTSTTTGQTDPMAGLPFRVDAGSSLKLAQRMGNMLVLTRSGSMARTSAQEPFYVIGPSVGSAPLDDLQRFAQRRAQQTAEISGLRDMQGRNLKVDGLDAYEIVADANDLRSGLPLRFYQVVAPDPGGYFIFQGLVGSDSAAEYLAEFRRLTASFRRHPPTVTGHRGSP